MVRQERRNRKREARNGIPLLSAEHSSFVIEGVVEHRFSHDSGGRSSSDCCIRVSYNSIPKKNISIQLY